MENLLTQERKSIRKNQDPVSKKIKIEPLTTDMPNTSALRPNVQQPQFPISEQRLNKSFKPNTSLNKIIEVLRKKLIESNEEQKGPLLQSNLIQEKIMVIDFLFCLFKYILASL